MVTQHFKAEKCDLMHVLFSERQVCRVAFSERLLTKEEPLGNYLNYPNIMFVIKVQWDL